MYQDVIVRSAIEHLNNANANHLRLLKYLLVDVDLFAKEKRPINSLYSHMKKVMQLPEE